MFEVEFYDTSEGQCPVQEFLDSLEPKIKAILTNGFVKKTQKTPKADLELAKKYKSDYERRYCNEQL